MTERWRVTLLSAVVPGLGQFELDARRAGAWFLGATVTLLVGSAVLDRRSGVLVLGLLELTAWACGHAWLLATRCAHTLARP
jgi:hypothetical protein